MTQLLTVSSVRGALATAAALDAGLLGADERRILLIGSDAPIPETCAPPDRAPGFQALARRCAEVIRWDEEIAPLHPAAWMPAREELPVFERLLRRSWGFGADPVELVAESLVHGPRRTLAAIFHDAPVTVCGPPLAAYGPTVSHLPMGVGSRAGRLLYLDLVPGLRPLLLSEYGIPAETVPTAAYRAVVAELSARPADEPADEPAAELADKLAAELADELAERPGDGTAMIIGAGPADEDEPDPHLIMLRAVAARGHRTVLFVPPPCGAPGTVRRLRAEAEGLGITLIVPAGQLPPEVWCAAARPELVVGAGDPGLVTACRLYGLAAATIGDGPLGRPAPFESDDRVPLTIIDALLARLAADGTLTPPPAAAEDELAALITAVAYCMRAAVYAGLRAEAAAFLAEFGGEPMDRYFDPARLTALGLPGAPAPPAPDPASPEPPAPADPPDHPRSPKRRSVGARIHRALRRSPRRTGHP